MVRRHRGFSLVELIVCVVILVVIAAVFATSMSGSRTHRRGHSRTIKDSTQVRGIHQGLIMFAQNYQDRYPLPSLLDKDDTTVALAEAGPAGKDTTANIVSILIFNGFFGPELCISPAEANAAIKQMPYYSYSNPPGTPNPAKALWDPAFSADFTSGKTGNLSYAHMQFGSGGRASQWRNSFSATEAAIGNRGPLLNGVTRKPDGAVTPLLANPYSNTLLIHGGRTTWEGNIAYNDNHVNFETSTAPEALTYRVKDQVLLRDCLFFDEPDDETGANAFLGIYTKAGSTPADYTSIWD